jgi:hypothetical protein
VFLRVERFGLIMRILGHTTDPAIARFIGMTDRTVVRARAGIIGERFIAAVLIALAPHADDLRALNLGVSFEDLFEVGDKSVAA